MQQTRATCNSRSTKVVATIMPVDSPVILVVHAHTAKKVVYIVAGVARQFEKLSNFPALFRSVSLCCSPGPFSLRNCTRCLYGIHLCSG